MKRILSFLFLFSLLTACGAPHQIPIPVTQGPTLVPPTLSAPVSSAPAFDSLHMIDATNGWAVTDTGVVRTNDGGITWHDVTPTGITKLGFGTTFYFFDSNHGWVVSGISDPATATHCIELRMAAQRGNRARLISLWAIWFL